MKDHPKPYASLSFDLDNLWSYMKTHGDPGWEKYPSYFEILIPRILAFLKERNLTITFFIVGQDAALERNHDLLRSIAEAGHEIGNHSFCHEQWLTFYTEEQTEKDLTLAEQHIESVTGQKPVGFRGPGYSLSPSVLKVLSQRGYLYDASTLPTYLGPLARLYYFRKTNLTEKEKEQRDWLFGNFRDGLRSIHPYLWWVDQAGDGEKLVEIPVTTMPIFKIPVHLSYILYISNFSKALAIQYFKQAMRLCRWTKTNPSLLLHPLDFLGCEDLKELSFFPGMNLPQERKLQVVEEVVRLYTEQFQVGTLKQHALEVVNTSRSLAVEQLKQVSSTATREALP